MIRDGLDEPALDRRECPGRPCRRLCGAQCAWSTRDAEMRALGWRPIATAPIAQLDVVLARGRHIAFTTAPNWIEGLTTHGNVVRARYFADGRYGNQWTNDRGNVRYMLTHWRPLRRN